MAVDNPLKWLVLDGTTPRTINPEGQAHHGPDDDSSEGEDFWPDGDSREDEDLWVHPGVNPVSSLRALWANMRNMRYNQGASTLTMQVVRSLSQNEEKTITRKLREMAMAVTIDGYLGKECCSMEEKQK